MEKIRFCVVGCGNIGKRHLAIIDSEDRAEIVALCDTDMEALSSLAGLYGIKQTFTGYNEMLKTVETDVVSICTPHGLHCEMSILASKAGFHVMVEKPMALTVEDCQKMIRTAEEMGTKLFVVKQNRHNTPIAITKEALDSGRLGKVTMVISNVLWNRHDDYYKGSHWRGRKDLEGGALYTQVSHFIDLLVWWFGEITHSKTLTETLHHQIEIEDCGVAAIKFRSGAIGSVNWTTTVYNTNYEGSITIIGEKGTVKIGGKYLNKIEFWDVQSYPLPEDITFEDKPNQYGKYQGSSSNHDKVIQNITAKLLNERTNVVEGDEGIKSIEAIELIYANS